MCIISILIELHIFYFLSHLDAKENTDSDNIWSTNQQLLVLIQLVYMFVSLS